MLHGTSLHDIRSSPLEFLKSNDFKCEVSLHFRVRLESRFADYLRVELWHGACLLHPYFLSMTLSCLLVGYRYNSVFNLSYLVVLLLRSRPFFNLHSLR